MPVANNSVFIEITIYSYTPVSGLFGLIDNVRSICLMRHEILFAPIWRIIIEGAYIYYTESGTINNYKNLSCRKDLNNQQNDYEL